MSWSRVLRWGLLIIVLTAAIVGITQSDRLDTDTVFAWVESLGSLGPLVFVGLYALATVLFMPGSVMTITGGLLFGLVGGAIFNLLGATLGATLAFLAARYAAGDWVVQRSGPKLGRLMTGVEREGWRFVAFVRLVPIFPFNLLNYALGLTKIRLGEYVLATFIFMIPASVAYTYLGVVGRAAAEGSQGTIRMALLALGLLAFVLFLPRLIKRLRASKTP